MTTQQISRDDFDRLMRQWMAVDGRVEDSDELLQRVVERTATTRRIPGWLLPEHWITVPSAMRLHAGPHAPIVIVLALLIALVVAIALIGSRPPLPPPFGVAGNGRLAYVSDWQIHTAEPDGSDPRQLTFGSSGATTPVWSPDGTRLAFRVLSTKAPADDPTGYGDLTVSRADGSDAVTIAAGLTGLSEAVWSPDGRSLAYSTFVEGDGVVQVFVASADGASPPVRVGDPRTHNWAPAWSPDASRLAYVTDNPPISEWITDDKADGVYIVAPDGTELRKLSTRHLPELSGAWWSPDGTQVLFSAGGLGQLDLWLVGLDGRPERVVAADPVSETHAAYSPDGRWIAFHRFDGSPYTISTHIVVMRADGSDARTLPGVFGEFGPAWSPDGTKLVVGENLRRPERIYLLDPTGAAEPIPLNLPPLGGQPKGPVPPGDPYLGILNPELPAWQRVVP